MLTVQENKEAESVRKKENDVVLDHRRDLLPRRPFPVASQMLGTLLRDRFPFI